MNNTVLVSLLGVFATVIVGLVVVLVAMLRRKPAKNPPEVDNAMAGQMAVSYWLRHLDKLHHKLDEIIELLKRQLEE